MCGRNGLVMLCGESYVRPQWPMNINETNDMRRRTPRKCWKTKRNGFSNQRVHRFNAFLCGRTGPLLYTLHVTHWIVQRNINYHNQTTIPTRPGGSAHISTLINPIYNIIQKICTSGGGCDLVRKANNFPRTEGKTTVSHLARLHFVRRKLWLKNEHATLHPIYVTILASPMTLPMQKNHKINILHIAVSLIIAPQGMGKLQPDYGTHPSSLMLKYM